MRSKILPFILGIVTTLGLLAGAAHFAGLSFGGAMSRLNLAQLQNALDYVDANSAPGSVERGQGHRYVFRAIEQNLYNLTDDHGPQTPTIDRCPTRNCKFGFDNPDTSYITVGPLNGAFDYRLTGQRGTVKYITYQVFNFSVNGFKTGDVLESGELVLDADGFYEIHMGAENTAGHSNFMRLPTDGLTRLVIRQLHHDWNTEIESALAIEMIPQDKALPVTSPIFDNTMMQRRGNIIGALALRNVKTFSNVINNELPLHDLPAPYAVSLGGGGGFPTNYTTAMRYEVGAGEAVIIEVPYAEAVYNNIQLASVWGESLDYASRLVSYNGHQAYLGADGIYRYIIAADDPGYANWLDTQGHKTGGVFMRWQSPPDVLEKPLVKPTVRKVRVEDLSAILPATHQKVPAAMRAGELRDRLQGYNRRKNPVGQHLELTTKY